MSPLREKATRPSSDESRTRGPRTGGGGTRAGAVAGGRDDALRVARASRELVESPQPNGVSASARTATHDATLDGVSPAAVTRIDLC
jgi:hypothetical protein